ncbi:adenylate kinase [Actinobaculum suis]|uniref:Adenylate kinase n=1 Tax=Actinobaculum suis TaxID=1657 RepID=A0A1G7AUN5_9ACTO|nr:adenylate kinase [Actinobaculum suis]MDY5153454.1 adenylate kinase [Actinobaculum suis]SDE18584.1 adenylate kinase [Actinobaculum suis]
MAYRLIIVGPPGAGKGTQAKGIAERRGIPAISTGDLFRAHAAAQDELGKLAASYSERGALVPDEVTNRMVAERIAEDDAAGGFLLDGYPRNLAQVDALDEMLGETKIDAVIMLDVDDDVVVRRLLGRAKQQNRADDTEEVIRHRLEVYHQETQPIVDAYAARGLVVRIDGGAGIAETTQRIETALQDFLG